MNREEYLKKLKESVETGKVDEDLTTHHYAILDKAQEKAKTVKLDLENKKKDPEFLHMGESVEEAVKRIREEGKPSANDRIRVDENGNLKHLDVASNDENDPLINDVIRLKNYASKINEILGEEKVIVKNGEIVVEENKNLTPEQITKDRVIKEITLLEEENMRCYSIIARNNDLLTYLKIELSTL